MLGATLSTPAARRFAKVPQVMLLFWVVKILTTGMGEAASDFFGQRGFWMAALVGGIGLIAALIWQFRTSRYQPFVYWSAVSWVAVFGTVAADVQYILELPPGLAAAVYTIAVAAVFFLWYRTERTLSVHSIRTPRREAFYWLAVLLTFALGTAVGDLTASAVGLGFASSAAVFAVAIVVPWMLFRRRLLGEVPAFWIAYILTRPLGASVADWLGKPMPLGVGFGDVRVTLSALALIVLLVMYLAFTRTDVQSEQADE